MFKRYVSLFLMTGVAGIASGLLWLIPSGLMGGALGMCLSGGTLWLGLKQARDGVAPSEGHAVAAGAVAGLLGGVCMAAISFLCAGLRAHEFGPPILPVWAPMIMGVLYGVVLLWCYQRRQAARRPVWSTLSKACGLCFLLKAVATFIYLVLTRQGSSDLMRLAVPSILFSLLGAVPFALFWVLATAWLDPAWSRAEGQTGLR